MNVLQITSSITGQGSLSRELAREIVATVVSNDLNATIVERDVASDPIAHITAETMAAVSRPLADRDPDQAAAASLADTLIEEIEAADVIVIAAPMYNFSIPSTLKAWIDHVARAGRTFHYTSEGPKGLLRGKRVYVTSTRGGFYGDGPAKRMDFHETYLRGVLGFIGLHDVTFIHAENQAQGGDVAAAARDGALIQIRGLIPGDLAA